MKWRAFRFLYSRITDGHIDWFETISLFHKIEQEKEAIKAIEDKKEICLKKS